MRTLAITQNITVDGSIEMLGDWFDPQRQGGTDNSRLLAELHRQGREADGLLLGRRTFEDLRGYWPQQSDDGTGIASYLNSVGKYVVSSAMTRPDWRNSTVLEADMIDQVRALKGEPGRDIVVTGSITLSHALIQAGLVDRYRLFVYPVVQGRRRRLFPDGVEVPELKLIETKTFRCGITYTRYATPSPRRSRPGGRSASGKRCYHCLSKVRRRSVAQGDRSTSSVVRRAQQGPRPHHR